MNSIKININNKEFNCELGVYTLGEVIEDLGMDYEKFSDRYFKNPFKYTPILLFHSIKADAFLNGKDEIDFEYKDLMKWIQEDGGVGSKGMLKFAAFFVDSLNKNVPKEEVKEVKKNDPKKK